MFISKFSLIIILLLTFKYSTSNCPCNIIQTKSCIMCAHLNTRSDVIKYFGLIDTQSLYIYINAFR